VSDAAVPAATVRRVTELIELGRDREAAELAGIPPDKLDEQAPAEMGDRRAHGCPELHEPTV
jgi:hypothetical protein